MKSSEDSDTFWSLFSHPRIYISALGSVLPVGWLYCSLAITFGADLPHQCTDLYNQVKCNMPIVDDNVEDAPIYRCKGKALKPTRPRENHGLAMEHVPTQSESHQKPQLKSFAVPAHGSLVKSPKIQGTQECT